MNPIKNSLCAAAVLACVAGPAFAGTNHAGPMTRDEVRASLREWRAAGALPVNGEAGDTSRTIAARDRLNRRQASEIVAAYEAEAAELAAMQAGEAERLAIEQSAPDATVALNDADTGGTVLYVYAPDETPVLAPVDVILVVPAE